MSKRGNGEGSIYQRKDGRWVGQYVVQMADGPRYRYIYGKTRKAVAERLTKAMADRDGGLVFEAGSVTVAEYLDRWLSDSVRDTVKERTFDGYESIVRVHLKPSVGKLKLKALSPAHVRGLYRQKLEGGLSGRRVQYIHVTLHKALKQAVMDGLIPRNVTEAVKPPRPSGKEIKPLNREQTMALLEAAKGDRLEAIFVLAVTSGLRQGELLGLRWEDLDLDAGTLAVRRTLSVTKSGLVFGTPKSAKSRRSVRLTPLAVQALKRHRTAQNRERLSLGSLWQDGDLVFPGETGQPLRPWSLTGGSFKRLRARAGLPDTLRFHDLRHTCATLLLTKGVHPKVVQELLGHATISITLDTYSHVLPNMQSEAVNAMEDALSGSV